MIINNIFDRDLYQGKKERVHEGKDVVILASEEFINDKFKLSHGSPDFQEKQKEHAELLFNEIWADPKLGEKYPCYFQKELNLLIVVLTTTAIGQANTLAYISEAFGEVVRVIR